MATLSYNGESWTVHHATKGSDYIHGYDENGKEVVTFDGITDFSDFTYSGAYMNPEECFEEGCNTVRYHSGRFKRTDGTEISVSEYFTATVGTEWVGDTAPYTQTIAVEGVLESDFPDVDIVLPDDYSEVAAAEEAFANIYRITTADNSITVYAKEKTVADVQIQLKVVR